MRIAHLGPTSLPLGHSFGGAVERRMLGLAGAQLTAGDDVVLFSAHAGDTRTVLNTDFDVRTIRCRTARPARDVEFLIRARRALRAWRPDVVHVHNNWAGAAVLRGVRASK